MTYFIWKQCISRNFTMSVEKGPEKAPMLARQQAMGPGLDGEVLSKRGRSRKFFNFRARRDAFEDQGMAHPMSLVTVPGLPCAAYNFVTLSIGCKSRRFTSLDARLRRSLFPWAEFLPKGWPEHMLNCKLQAFKRSLTQNLTFFAKTCANLLTATRRKLVKISGKLSSQSDKAMQTNSFLQGRSWQPDMAVYR